MPGIATHFTILELAAEQLRLAGDSRLTRIIESPTLRPYLYLGAIGPTLFDFTPADSSNPYWSIWREVFGLMGDDMARASGRGVLSLLAQANAYVDTFGEITEDEDLVRALSMLDELDELDGLRQDAEALESDLASVVPTIPPLILEMRPALDDVPAGDPVPSPDQWRVREFLSWKKTGQFARALLERADRAVVDAEEGAEEFQAYAYGYLTSYAANVCGSPFINSIVGAPYRTTWWRHRWVNNYVDAWVYGYYAFPESERPVVDTAADVVNPEYDQWPSLCSANLHDLIRLPGVPDPQTLMETVWQSASLPTVLNEQVGELWNEVFREVYASDPIPPAVDPSALNAAYLMTWLVLWFQTSSETGDLLGCQLPDTDPPAGCEPPDLETEPDEPRMPSRRSIDWGLFLTIMGFLLGALGAFFSGIATIVENLPEEEDWADARCFIYWWRMYLVSTVGEMHVWLTRAGLTHPYARDLMEDSDLLSVELPGGGTIPITWPSGWRLTKSKVVVQGFPISLALESSLSGSWLCSLIPDAWWFFSPDDLERWFRLFCGVLTQVENPQRVAYLSEEYPRFFVSDDALNPLSNGDVRTAGTFPVREPTPGGDPVQFGNAVANCVDLLNSLDSGTTFELPNWNLDADRGLAHLTWQFAGGIYTQPVNIEPEA